jgi:hypothetical protein
MADKTIDPRQVLFEYGANALASNHPEGGSFHIDDTMIDEALQALLTAIDEVLPEHTGQYGYDSGLQNSRDAIHKFFGEKS